MILRFKQKMFSWLGSYSVFDEEGNTVYTVKGELSWARRFRIYDAGGNDVGLVKKHIWSLYPSCDLICADHTVATIRKEITFVHPHFTFSGELDWDMQGNWTEWDYTITDSSGVVRATLCKEFWNWTDTYRMEIPDERDALYVLMTVIAIDAEKGGRSSD